MIMQKSSRELEMMKDACKISAQALCVAGEAIKAGVTTREVDKKVHSFILSCKAKPSFLGYGGFPASACISINNVVIHGIPGDRIIKDGDIVSVDVGAYYNGFHGDNAATFAVGEVSEEAKKLLDVTKESLHRGIEKALMGNRIGDISNAVEQYVISNGFAVVKQFVGHGVGRNLHESPEVPNYGHPGHGARLLPGMTIAIEPMVNARGSEVVIMPDKWTTVTKSGSLAAHFEHTIAITENGPVIMTQA